MKDIFVSQKCFGKPDDPGFGSWWEKGHWELDYVKRLADNNGKPEIEAYHVLLTREEWEHIANGLGLSDDWSLE